tara:strand:+ start:911 stop:1393 length:483 start_codon:yes stop_codon:yes gene_type:complete
MFATQLNANEKIVFIDINYIFNNSDAGKKLQNEILEKNDQINNEINKFKIDIENKKKKLLAQKNVMSVEEYNKKVSAIDKQINEMNISISNKKKELEIYKKKLENSFSKNLNKFIEQFSEKNSIDIILNKENLLMAKKKLNITQEIFNLFNNQVKSINVN